MINDRLVNGRYVTLPASVKQEFRHGYQVELPDAWVRYGSPWEIVRPQHQQEIPVYGHVETVTDEAGKTVPVWVGFRKLIGIPYDIPIPGYKNGTVNTLRLWKAAATDEFDLGEFNAGSYAESVAAKNAAEISALAATAFGSTA